jgi:dihydrolipoamide dehydrogenase
MYDVVIIGGGPGGYAAAIRTAQLGGKVALVEAAQIGGTCVNRGCISSKVWLNAAELLFRLRKAATFGIDARVEGVRLEALHERAAGVAGDIRMGMEGLLQNNGVRVLQGHARLKAPGTVALEGEVLETRRVIIATGSRVDVPAVPGLETAAMTTDQVFELTAIPTSLFIWGAGPIEMEMATLFVRFGARVSVATESARILPQEDRDTSQRVAQTLRTEGVEILTRQRLEAVQPAAAGCTVRLSGTEDRQLEVQRVLCGARKPNTAHMGLRALGAHLNADGSLRVDEHLQTTLPDVYAVGDATGGAMLSHAASAMGIVAAENAMGRSAKFPFGRIPRGIWTSPEVGAVGLSEAEAEAQGFEVEVGNFPYAINGLAMARDQITGAVKIVSETRYGRILGVHVVGAGATELIGEAVLAMELEATVREYARSLRVHPTFSETLVEAARDAAGWALYLPRRKA